MDFTPNCPVPISEHSRILLAHGGGGRLTQQLIEKIFAPAFSNPLLNLRHDGAVFETGRTKLAFTTDSYVVRPLFFPGGDIGSLAINGTVNDLAMCGAKPLYLSAGFIIEEGFATEKLWQVVQSMRKCAAKAGVQVVTGDTKVVDKGKGDELFINTAGVGIIEHDLVINPGSVRCGDVIVLSGDIGRHGIAIMAARQGLEFTTEIESDCAPVVDQVKSLIDEGVDVHCLRDLTRGGLATALVEIAQSAQCHISIAENAIPVHEQVDGVCEILGLDPMYIANEGRFVAFVAKSHAKHALEIINRFQPEIPATVIGEVTENTQGMVTMKSKIGVSRIVDMLSGEQLPRIC